MTDIQLVSHADAAMQLHRLLAHFARGLANPALGGGNGALLLRFGHVGIQRHRRHHHDGACQFAFDEHVCHAMLQRLETAYWGTKLLARLAVFDSLVQQHVQRANGFCTHAQRGAVDALLQGRQCSALLAQQRTDGYLHIVKADLGRAMPIHGRVVTAHDARGVRCDHHNGNAFHIALAASRAHRHQQRIGNWPIEHQHLGAIHQEMAARNMRRRRHTREVVAALFFVKRACQLQTASHELRQQVLFLRRAAQRTDKPAAQDDTRHKRLDNQRLAEFFHQHHQVSGQASEPAIGFRERHCQPAQLGKQRPVFGTVPCSAGQNGAARIEGVMAVHEFLHAFLQHLLLITE